VIHAHVAGLTVIHAHVAGLTVIHAHVAGLTVIELLKDRQRPRPSLAGTVDLAGAEQDVAEGVKQAGFAEPVTDLTAVINHPPIVGDRLLVIAQLVMDVTEGVPDG
jgi:hypothetical protein